MDHFTGGCIRPAAHDTVFCHVCVVPIISIVIIISHVKISLLFILNVTMPRPVFSQGGADRINESPSVYIVYRSRNTYSKRKCALLLVI